MFSVVKELTNRRKFYDKTKEDRLNEAAKQKHLPPFNRRAFTKTKFVLTQDIRNSLQREGTKRSNEDRLALTPLLELMENIHKNDENVKEALSLTLEFKVIDQFSYFEREFDLLYILSGSLEITFDQKVSDSTSFYQPNFVYLRNSGEYVGLTDEISDDYNLPKPAKPSTVYAKETCVVLVLSYCDLRRNIEAVRGKDGKEKEDFLASKTSSWLRDERKRLIGIMSRIDFQPNRALILQHETQSEWIYFIVSGRCQVYKSVNFPDFDTSMTFKLHRMEEGSIVGTAGCYDDEVAVCSVVTVGRVVCYKIKRSDLHEDCHPLLLSRLHDASPRLPSDDQLREFAYLDSLWRQYRITQVKFRLQGRASLTTLLMSCRLGALRSR